MTSLIDTPSCRMVNLIPVRIEVGCISCLWCSTLMGEVFEIHQGTARIRPEILADPDHVQAETLDQHQMDFLTFVADGCSAQVIKIA